MPLQIMSDLGALQARQVTGTYVCWDDWGRCWVAVGLTWNYNLGLCIHHLTEAIFILLVFQ